MSDSAPALMLDRINYLQIKDLTPDEIGEQVKRCIPLLFPKPGVDYKVHLSDYPPVHEGEELVTRTLSVCPYCYSLVTAVLVKRDGKVYERKVCPEHGEFEELYFGDYSLHERFRRWQKDGKGVWTPNVQLQALCP
ncbi:MAG: radical SAM protein, partial [Thermofilaceae archaeon]